MQTLISRRLSRGSRPRRDAAAERRREIRLGALGVALVVSMLVAVAVLYAVPFGKRTYTAWLPEAQSVRTGDDVRLAGISVGTVRSLELTADHVIMTFTVDDSVFVGRETSLDVRMLTIVGGHYVALFPAGTAALGGGHIPADRVRLPYSLSDAFQDAVTPVRGIDGNGWRENLTAIADSLTAGPTGIRDMLDGVQHFVDVLDQQRAEVSRAIGIADEYIGTIDDARAVLGTLVTKINLLETVLGDKRTEVRTAVDTLDRVIARIAALQPSWQSTLRPMAEKLVATAPELEALGTRLQPLIDAVHQLGERMRGMLPTPGDAPADTALSFCVPVAGKSC
ncbi:MlaD family protein [Nocardia jejuensis]|uniref:MlaD family protein n=1 Tax=Nocardia jejuensis TaxID=328049 RepID=UPI0008376379|nr:MlaD family protein [Nocardia jejuensis]